MSVVVGYVAVAVAVDGCCDVVVEQFDLKSIVGNDVVAATTIAAQSLFVAVAEANVAADDEINVAVVAAVAAWQTVTAVENVAVDDDLQMAATVVAVAVVLNYTFAEQYYIAAAAAVAVAECFQLDLWRWSV